MRSRAAAAVGSTWDRPERPPELQLLVLAAPLTTCFHGAFNTIPLAQTSFAIPNQVNDYFDDPRLEHT